MYHKRTNRLVEICPQCFRGIDKSTSRLVSDVCGHSKCRICLLQEINGCLKCAGVTNNLPPQVKSEPPPRKSVITNALQLQNDQAHQSTCQIIQETMKKDILFPKEIVKQSTSNFFHLKRLISKRFFSEHECKKDKSCETEVETEKTDEKLTKLPGHIQYFCNIHNITLTDDISIEQHLSCSPCAKVFKCPICERPFPTEYKVKRHIRSHDPAPNYQCTICAKRFKDNYALRTHLRKHTGDKVFACHLCVMKFSQLWSLKRHLAKHRGERNFVCEVCDYRFLTRPELRRHQVTHMKTKAFICQACGARFTFKRSLARHKAIHNDVSINLRCPICRATFKRKDNLNRHVRNAHGDQGHSV